METHSPSPPITVGIQPSSWLHSGDKNSPSYQNSLLQGMNNIDFLFMGDTHIRHNIVFFLCSCRCLALGVFAPVTPSHRTALCSSGVRGGLCGDFCTAVFLRGGALAGRYGHSTFFWKISVVRYHYKMFICVHSCKDAFSFSRRSLSLSICIIFRSVHSIISHIFSGIV